MDDEIKLAGLEALVPEELEKHLILNSNRLRTLEDARLEIVTYVEAKFGLRIRDSKPSDTVFREHSDPMDVGTVNSLSSGTGRWSSAPRDGCFKCGAAHFQRECNAPASNRLAKAITSSRGPRVRLQSEARERVKRTKENPKDCPKEPRVRTKNPRAPKAHAKAKPRKRVSQVLGI